MRQFRFNPRATLVVAALCVLLSGLTLSTAGCKNLTREIHVSAVAGTTNRVLDRHDAYVNADTAVTDKASQLADSTEVRAALKDKETVDASVIEQPLGRVMDRHDVYTTADSKLSDVKRNANLRDTTLLRQLLKEAGKKSASPVR